MSTDEVSVYSNSFRRVSGPWLVNWDALVELDEIANRAADRLRKDLERRTEAEVDALVDRLRNENPDADIEELRAKATESIQGRYRFNPEEIKKQLVIGIGASSSIQASTLEAMRKGVLAQTAVPTSMKLTVSGQEHNCSIEIKDDWASIHAMPDGDDIASTLAMEYVDWAEKHKSEWPLRVWHGLKGVHLIVLFFAAMLGLAVGSKKSDAGQADARQLLEDGISSEEVPAAVEALLRMQLGGPSTFAPWLTPFLVAAAVLSVVGFFCPPTIFGIGAKAEKRIQLWKWWGRLVYITAPAWVLGKAWPSISSAVWPP